MASNSGHPSVKLNVGGRIFETTLTTLQAGGPDSLLYALSNRSLAEPNPVFIDRDPEIFSVLLSLLRTNRLPSTALRCFSAQDLADEALYYGVEPILRSALAPVPLSGSDASVSTTIVPAVDGFASTFAAANDGSVWIAHRGQVSGYDWSLSHVGTIRTHLDEITSVVRVWPEIVAVGSDSAAGLHFYDFSGGRHVESIHWTDPSDPRIYKARVTALGSSPSSAFASFECPHKENSVFEIDKSTLKMVSQFGRQSGSSTKNMAARRLIWLPERNIVCGTAVSCGAFGYSGYIRLWDPRCSDEVIWETVEPGSGRSSRFGDSFADADVDREESVIFKVCSKSGDLGMAELRKLGDDPWVYLKDTNPSMRNTNVSNSVIHCYRKQVFVGKEGNLEVWSRVKNAVGGAEGERDQDYRRNFVDKVEDAERGVITKIEGGGDRLFVGREDVEGIEVWESSDVAVADSVL